jgi:hypothetical protein
MDSREPREYVEAIIVLFPFLGSLELMPEQSILERQIYHCSSLAYTGMYDTMKSKAIA